MGESSLEESLALLSGIEEGVIHRLEINDLLRQVTLTIHDPERGFEADVELLHVTCLDVIDFHLKTEGTNWFSPESLWGINEFAVCSAIRDGERLRIGFRWEGGVRSVEIVCLSLGLEWRTPERPLTYPNLDSTRV